MAIARKPGAPPPAREGAAEKFIAGAGQATATVPEGSRRKPAMVRFDADLLARVDRAAKRRGISRSAWIQYTLSRALDGEEGLDA